VTPKYPDDAIQTLASAWWTEDKTDTIVRGRLIWTLIPYPEMKPYRLVPIGRGDDPKQHSTADFRIESFRIGDPPKGIATLPVAALPVRDGETYIVGRGKRRPAVVISVGGAPVLRELRAGQNRWQSAPTILVAPYYGADPGSSRGGWPAPFVERIRRAEYPQYMWDVLPIGAVEQQSILRLDHLMPVGADSANWQMTSHVLSEEARGILDEWVSWLITGSLSDQSALGYARTELGKL